MGGGMRQRRISRMAATALETATSASFAMSSSIRVLPCRRKVLQVLWVVDKRVEGLLDEARFVAQEHRAPGLGRVHGVEMHFDGPLVA
ncbi:hypothetical protein BCR44DRAFT_1444741 [Catenaria anguillulae PL171]|uniref:Uncharacterized protein n=1 Tax=Catenaria anguillulae PL171 TaxID=765915 RepID=A0A1Y2H7E2_9FUNG|nr:hypothetical protein BCR44DRAFT_1444741 [Catenaria anguillulae PL171]